LPLVHQETRYESEMAWIQNSPQTGYVKLGEAAHQIQEPAALFENFMAN